GRVVAALALQEHLVLLAHPVGGGGRDPFDERRRGLLGADHLVLGGVRRPGRVAQQGGQLVASGQEPVQDVDVVRVAALAEECPQPPPRVGVVCVGQKRQHIGVVGG